MLRVVDVNLTKKRSTNYTREEELLLVSQVAKFKNVIECKLTDKGNNQRKEYEEKQGVIKSENDPYTARNLEAASKKSGVSSNMKHGLYEKLIMLAEEEIKKNRLEQEEILIKRQRDNEKHDRENEEHRKRMELLDLEIEAKRRMLNN
ncbi:unnamed protein product [Acanthoscelides obtectus]|uniref:Uncharacterized protein n=1 Tax=Acanthoscelides obtectus TaxID=200917 RepID=A0A9P0LBP6_ACAOB|nr:unnamed protein product [Acanthoscelides obtectus]CAK1638976.1 hypothetical protein AOBTE_LOCUS10911 [Acanthoscelides obtectus]